MLWCAAGMQGELVTSSRLLEIRGWMNTMWTVLRVWPPRPSPSAQTTELPTAVVSMQVWFQNRRSKERRMKQLSALGARRHAFFRGPRRMRPLGGRLEDPDILGPGAYGYYGGTAEPLSCCLISFLSFLSSLFFIFQQIKTVMLLTPFLIRKLNAISKKWMQLFIYYLSIYLFILGGGDSVMAGRLCFSRHWRVKVDKAMDRWPCAAPGVAPRLVRSLPLPLYSFKELLQSLLRNKAAASMTNSDYEKRCTIFPFKESCSSEQPKHSFDKKLFSRKRVFIVIIKERERKEDI